jgi:DNA-binding LacI/PurR family transcriptional regulator
MATMYDICSETGLSSATISRVINNSNKVSEKNRKRVLDTMKRLNFQPNQAARMLAGKKTDTLSVILPEIDNGFYVQVLRGINEATKEAKLHLLITFYDDKKNLQEILQTLSSAGRADAIIVMNSALPVRELDQMMVGNNTPMVLIGHRIQPSEKFDIIGIDNVNGSCAAVNHLLEQGFKNLMFITGPNHYLDSTQRLQGAKQALTMAGMDFSEVRILKAFFNFDDGKRAMKDFLTRNTTLPDAIFAFNDQMALGAIDALKDQGLKVPGDVAVIGFDDSEIAKYSDLSTVHVPMRDIGIEAGSLAIRRMKNRSSPPTTINLVTSLKLRSTG